MILIPAKGLTEENATPANYEDKKKEGILEYDEVVRIRDKAGSYDEEGDMWFWNDEDMAKRLAGYLKPTPDPKHAPLPPRQEEVKAAGAAAEPTSARGFWGRRKSGAKALERLPPIDVRKIEPVESQNEKEQEGASMNVTAEEVVFRLENDFCVFETRRGFGIVLQIQVLQQKNLQSSESSDSTISFDQQIRYHT